MTDSSATREALATVAASMQALERRTEEIGKDAREARDNSIRALTVLGEQKVGERLGELHKAVEATEERMRGDLVNAVTKAREEAQKGDSALLEKHDALAERVDALETERDKQAGAKGVLHWLSKHAPWLLAVIISAADVLHLKLKVL